MIAVDTNIIVRFLTRDDEEQFRISSQVFLNNEVFIPDSVILETEWVLRYAYGFPAGGISQAFRKLFGMSNVHLGDARKISQAIDWHEKGLDFADAMHLAFGQNCPKLITFDEKFIKRAVNLSNCRVTKP